MEQRENQRVKLTRRLIKESLIRLLGAQSIYKVSIRALCEEAGVNRSTFYRYYGSQYDVLFELEADLLGSIQDTLDDARYRVPGSEREQLAVICGYLARNVDTVRLLISNNVDPGFPEKLFSLPQIRRRLHERLAGHYDSEQREYVFTFLINGCYHLVREWISRDGRRDAGELAELLLSLIDKVCS